MGQQLAATAVQASLPAVIRPPADDHVGTGRAPIPPAVTIMIAARDRRPLLQEAISSALAQTWRDLEVLVVDDGSKPPNAAWLDRVAGAEPRLRVVHQRSLGVAAARARGLLQARGQWVCILDSDDLLRADAIERAMAVLQVPDGPDVVYCDNFHRYEDGSERRVRYPDFAHGEAMLRAVLCRPQVPFKHTGTTAARATFLRAGGYRVRMRIKVDIDLYLRLLRAGCRLHHLPEPLVTFRFNHKSSMSRWRFRGIAAWVELIGRYSLDRGPVRWRQYAQRVGAELGKVLWSLVARCRR